MEQIFLTPWLGDRPNEDIGPVPECYTPDEWEKYYVAAKMSGEGTYPFDRDSAFELACIDCQLCYQNDQTLLNKCHPLSFDLTPGWREADG